MHIAALVVTSKKPTKSILVEALTPFGQAAGAKFKLDWWALGGRFSGQLIPHDKRDTVTGGLAYPDDELPLVPNDRHEPGPGVDALLKKIWTNFVGRSLAFSLSEVNCANSRARCSW